MRREEFYRVFANTPIWDRFKALDRIHYGSLTLSGIYQQLQSNDELVAKIRQGEEELLKIADEYYKHHDSNHTTKQE